MIAKLYLVLLEKKQLNIEMLQQVSPRCA